MGQDLISQHRVGKQNLETLVGENNMSFQQANGVSESDMIAKFRDSGHFPTTIPK